MPFMMGLFVRRGEGEEEVVVVVVVVVVVIGEERDVGCGL